MCYAGSALQDTCLIMHNDGSEGERESEWERKGELRCDQNAWGFQTDAALQSDSHAATVQSHTRARETKVCLCVAVCKSVCVCFVWVGLCICVHIPAGRLVPIQWFVIMSTHNSTHMSKSMPKSQRWFNLGCLSSSHLSSLHRNPVASHRLLSLSLYGVMQHFFSCVVFLFIGS